MRLMSYNIHGGVGTDGIHDYARIGDFLQQRQVDVALLQEFDTRPRSRITQDDIDALCGRHFRWLLPSPTVVGPYGWYGNAILTRYPATYTGTVDTSQHGFESRNIQEAILRTPQGPLHVINTHNGLNRIERQAQIHLLSTHLRQRPALDIPLVVAGDFNEWQLFSRAFTRVDRLLHPQPAGKTFPTRLPLFRLDRAWCKPRELVQAIQVVKTPLTRYLSDHYPLELELALPAWPLRRGRCSR